MDDATALFIMDLAVELGQGLDHVLQMPEDEFCLWLLRKQIKLNPPERNQTEEEIMAAFA